MLAVIAIAILMAIAYTFSQPQVRARLLQALWRIPAVGERMRVYQLARFYKTLGMLLRGGIPVTQALEMVSNLYSRIFDRG